MLLTTVVLATLGENFGSLLCPSSIIYKLSSSAAASFRMLGGMSKIAFMALSKSVVAAEVCREINERIIKYVANAK